MTTLAKRLQEAFEISGKTREALIEELKKRGVQGASYPSLRTYLSGDVEPSLAFLRATAEVCGVEEAWLVVGAGSIRETAARSSFEVLNSAIQTHLPDWDRLRSSTRYIVVETFFRLSGREWHLLLESGEAFDQHVVDVVRAVSAPLEVLRVRIEDLSRQQLNTYVLNFCLAVRALDRSF